MHSPWLPDIPTLLEGSARGYEFAVWWGLVAPARMPAAIITRHNTEINSILADADVIKQLAAEGAAVTAWLRRNSARC